MEYTIGNLVLEIQAYEFFYQKFNLFAAIKREINFSEYAKDTIQSVRILIPDKEKQEKAIKENLIKKFIELSEVDDFSYSDYEEAIEVKIKG